MNARDLANPIRLAGLLALGFLVVPGTLHGVLLLLAHTGYSAGIPPGTPQAHALLQVCGFFMMLTWGFLTHALPGMLGADDRVVLRIRYPLVALAGVLASLWGVELVGGAPEVRIIIMGVGEAVVLAGTALLLRAVATAKRSWRTRPFPFLVIPLALYPVAWGMTWARAAGVHVPGGAEVLLLAVAAPIILAMSYRMFAPMMGLQLPRERWFDVGAVSWAAFVVARVVTDAPWVALLQLVAAVALVISLRVFERGRSLASDRGAEGHRVQHAYSIVACSSLVLAPLVRLVGETGMVGGVPLYWQDLSRHLVGIGFALVLVMGITQRVLPNMVRGRAPSLPWMRVNLGLLTVGLVLRFAEPYLPTTTVLVRASALFLYAGVIGYAAHMARGLLMPALLPPQVFLTIRRTVA